MTILQRPSPNCYPSRSGWKPDIIVNHITAGDAAGPALNWFANPNARASAHFIVDKDGTMYQCVPLTSAAWANGTSTGNLAHSLSTLEAVRQRKTNANLYTVSIEHVCRSGGALTDAQLSASIELHRFIIAEVKRLYGVEIPADRNHIVGHCEINPKTKPSCPGKEFPYDKIIAELNGGAAYQSDTAGTVIIPQGKNYLLKITGEDIPLVAGTPGIIELFRCRKIGRETLWHIFPLPTSKAGDKVGVYREGHEKICTIQIGGKNGTY